MTEDERDCYIEMWKETIGVQKHFNDIEMRIRGLALTILTFVLGGASVAVRYGTTVKLNGFKLQLGALILVLGVFLWMTFYMVDQIWYHRLLMGAVIHGEELEKELRKVLPLAGLTRQISKSSPYELKISVAKWVLWKHELHTKGKIFLFYWFIAGLLVVFAVIVQLTVQPSSPTSATGNSSQPTPSISPSSPTSATGNSSQPTPTVSGNA